MISIHAPARGATTAPYCIPTATMDFNPRTREGCDVQRQEDPLTKKDFNPRTREGCDAQRGYTARGTGDFNPRTREGCDGSPLVRVCPHRNFNPRTREGCDVFNLAQSVNAFPISIHAPARGATLKPSMAGHD